MIEQLQEEGVLEKHQEPLSAETSVDEGTELGYNNNLTIPDKPDMDIHPVTDVYPDPASKLSSSSLLFSRLSDSSLADMDIHPVTDVHPDPNTKLSNSSLVSSKLNNSSLADMDIHPVTDVHPDPNSKSNNDSFLLSPVFSDPYLVRNDSNENMNVSIRDKNFDRVKRDTTPQFQSLINSVTSAQYQGKLYLSNSNNVIKITVETSKLYNKIGHLSTAINSLQSITSYGHLSIDHYPLQGRDIYVINNDLKISDCSTFCSEKAIKLADLDSIMNAWQLRKGNFSEILLADTITTSMNSITCAGPFFSDNDLHCYAYYKLRAAFMGKIFYKSLEEMTSDLKSNYLNKVVHLALNSTHVYFTNNTSGACACTGDIQEDTSSEISSLIHGKYIQKYVSTLQLTLDSLLQATNSYVEFLDSKSIVTFSAPNHHPVHFSHEELITLCKKLFPTNLIQISSSKEYKFTQFSNIFLSSINQSVDEALINWRSNNNFENLPLSCVKNMYVQLSQLNTKLVQRLSAYIHTDSARTARLTVPLPILFKNTSKPEFYFKFLLSFLPDLDESTTFKIFSTIQRVKTDFYNNLVKLNVINSTKIAHTHTQPILPTPKPKLGVFKTLLENNNSSILFEEFKLSFEPTILPTTSTTTSTTTTVRTIATNRPTRFMPTFGPVDSKAHLYQLTLPITDIIRPRQKRNIFSDILSSATGLATQTEVSSMVQFEKNLRMQEQNIETQVLNITKATDDLLHNVQTIGLDLTKILKDEKSIFSDIHTLVANQTDIANQLKMIIDTITTASKYQSKFTNILLEINILQASVLKLKSIINSLVTQTVDIGFLDMVNTNSHLGEYAVKSLSSADAIVYYNADTDNYEINYVISDLSSTYSIYKLSSIPLYMESVPYALKINKWIATNLVGDVIFLTNYLDQCINTGSDKICKLPEVNILHNQTSCELQIVQTLLHPENVNLNSCTDKFRPTEDDDIQSFLYKGSFISLSSSIQDMAFLSCNSIIVENYTIDIGSNFINISNKQSCVLHTSIITIYIKHQPNEFTVTANLIPESITNSINELDNYLTDNLNLTYSYMDTRNLLKNLTAEHLLLNSDVYTLNNHVDRLLGIKENNKFQPLSLDFEDPSSPSNTLKFVFWAVIVFGVMLLVFMCTSCFSTIKTAVRCIIAPCELLLFLIHKCKTICNKNIERNRTPDTIILHNLPTGPDLENDIYNPAFQYPQLTDMHIHDRQPGNIHKDKDDVNRYTFDHNGQFLSARILFKAASGDILIYNHHTKALEHHLNLYTIPVPELPQPVLDFFNRDKQSVDIKYYKPDGIRTCVVGNSEYTYIFGTLGYITNGRTKIYGVPNPNVD